MAAGLTDHIWTVKELLMTLVAPEAINTEWGDCLMALPGICSYPP